MGSPNQEIAKSITRTDQSFGPAQVGEGSGQRKSREERKQVREVSLWQGNGPMQRLTTKIRWEKSKASGCGGARKETNRGGGGWEGEKS